eukprot:jgi/Galph1/2115/GphlegSOOS_G782.1
MVLKKRWRGLTTLENCLKTPVSEKRERITSASVSNREFSEQREPDNMTGNFQRDLDIDDGKDLKRNSSLTKELTSLALLTSLYFLQGLPMGLMVGSIPFMLQEKASYTQIGVFSLATYPYSLKLLWSPLVDSYYSKRIGRRRTWIIPVQLLCGISLIILGRKIQYWVEQVQVIPLTSVCFLLVLLIATQDIAVDGWALSMLSKNYLGYASTCQSLGITSGFFTSFTGFVALNDASFCNVYIRHIIGGEGPVLTLDQILRLTGSLYLCLTVLLVVSRREDPPAKNSPQKLSRSFYHLYRLLQLSSLRSLIAVLLLGKVAFAVHDNVYSLKLLERGFRRQDLAFIAVFQLPFQLVGTIVISRWCTLKRPLFPYILGYKIRLFLIIPFILLIAVVDNFETPVYFALVMLLNILYHIASDVLMFVSMGAYFARISDENMGGTYLTLLNTLQNLGGTWPKMLALFLVDQLTWKNCMSETEEGISTVLCKTWVDGIENLIAYSAVADCTYLGFYLASMLCLIIGFILMPWIENQIRKLEGLPCESFAM